MRHYPDMENKWEAEEWNELNAEDWMLECLKMNPQYNLWGPHEDYMWKDGDGWDSRVMFESWSEFGPWNLDDLNEVVNFYFFVERESVTCERCDGSGYNPETKKIADNYYGHSSKTGIGWNRQLTDDEYEALMESRNITRQEAEARVMRAPLGVDAIDRLKLVEVRARRLGVYGECEHCNGKGYIYTESAGRIGLTLWVLHPRKGCSRGVEIKKIENDELPSVYAFLREAANRNEDRFSLIPKE